MDGNENKPENLVKEETVEKYEENNKEKEENISKSATENSKVEHIKVHEDSDKEEEIERFQRETNNKDLEKKIEIWRKRGKIGFCDIKAKK